jgi:hypothetical protein
MDPSTRDASPSSLQAGAFLHAQLAQLDTPERSRLLFNPFTYLVEQVTRVEQARLPASGQVELRLQNAVKELVWWLRRSDDGDRNEHAPSTSGPDGEGPLVSAGLLFNGQPRLDAQPAWHFSRVQPYQHHSCGWGAGRYCYSFALRPEALDPSGHVNMSLLNRVRLDLVVDAPGQYDLVLFALGYNWLYVAAGDGKLVFTR